MFTLNILTPENELFAGPAAFLAATAVDGEVGVLTGHASLISVLVPGPIRYQLESGDQVRLDGGAGLLIVKDNQATVLLKR